MVNVEYSRACTEILAIINNMSIKNISKIPKELIDNFEFNQDKNYNFYFDYSKNLEDQNISNFTIALLSNLYRDYLVDENKKSLIIKNENKKRYELEKIKRERYNPDDIFKKKNTNVSSIKNSNETTSMVEYKETIFIKIINIIKKAFNKKI